MRRLAALFPIALALGATGLAPAASAREPTPIKACGTISQPGSYELVNNLTATTNDDCLVITTDFVTVDLAGFSITGSTRFPNVKGSGITAGDNTIGIAVRNGSILGFGIGVDLGGDGSIVEGLRVFGGNPTNAGIVARGIVKGNTVESIGLPSPMAGAGVGISATGIVTGNYVSGAPRGFVIGEGSTVIGNTVTVFGAMMVSCPSNVTDNTVKGSLELNGEGCNSTNNVAP